jgi:hypothetical protein
MVPDADGKEVEGVLMSAVVMEHEKAAFCGLNTEDGRGFLIRAALSDAELAAWKRHPDTFFGEVSRNRESKTVLDLYDFFMESYTKTPKAKLLEFLAGAKDIDHLSTLDQPALASVYCERLAGHASMTMGPRPAPVLQTKWRAASGAARNSRGSDSES